MKKVAYSHGSVFRARLAGLLKILSARRQRESLGAYEKVRISRILREANSRANDLRTGATVDRDGMDLRGMDLRDGGNRGGQRCLKDADNQEPSIWLQTEMRGSIKRREK
jgi:hypothetical protein